MPLLSGFFSELCRPTSHYISCRSVCQNELTVPCHTLSTAGWHASTVAAWSVWNSSADYLRDLARELNSFGCPLETFLFAHY